MPTNHPIIVVLDDFERSAHTFAPAKAWAAIESNAMVHVHTSSLRGAPLIAAIEDAQVIVLMRDRTPIDEALLAQLPRLKYIVFTGARNGLIDMAAVTKRGIHVSYTEFGPSKDATAELTIALLLASFKRLDLHLQTAGSARVDAWRPGPVFQMPKLVRGATLGLIGLGAIGSKVATIAQAMGMPIVTWSPNMTPERAQAQSAKAVSLPELLATSDVVSLHMVLAPATRHLIAKDRLLQMKKGAVLINTSRSGLIDETALIAALSSGHLSCAAVDVFDVEPVPVDYPLTKAPNVITTPHLGFVIEPVYENFWAGVTEALQAWLSNQVLPRPYLGD